MKKTKSIATQILCALLFIWVMAAHMTFRFRHPWATETELMMYFVDSLKFNRVDYQEMRPRG